MNPERINQRIHGLSEQIAQIDSLAPADCPNWLVQERELMVDEIKGLEARLRQSVQQQVKIARMLLTKEQSVLSLGEVA